MSDFSHQSSMLDCECRQPRQGWHYMKYLTVSTSQILSIRSEIVPPKKG
jgi:hypothetical protein